MRALAAALDAAPDARAAAPVLEGLVRATRLACGLGLDALCEDLLAVLAAAAGVAAPAPAGAPAEAKQVGRLLITR